MRGIARATLALAAGCAPMLSTMQPGETVGKDRLHLGAAIDVSVPAGQIVELADAASELSDRSEEQALTDAEIERLEDASVGLVLAPPSVGAQVLGRYGIREDWEVGGRLSPGSLRAEARWQFLGVPGGDGLKGTLGMGLGYYRLDLPDSDVVLVEDYRRLELVLPATFGWGGRFGFFWFGPIAALAPFSTSMNLDLGDAGEVRALDVSGTLAYLGGQVGGAIGYRWLFLAAELTVARMSGRAEVVALSAVRDIQFGGTVVHPSIGLMARFP